MDEVDEVRYMGGGECSMDVLGIDISKADFHVCLIQGNKRSKKSFPNTSAGYRQVHNWLKNRRCSAVHACMEATGSYWEGLAKALYDSGRTVSVINPAQTVFFARSQLRRTKTDVVDAEMIAEFCQERYPDAWAPPPDEILELRGLLTYRDHLVQQVISLKQMATQIHVSKDLRKLHVQQVKAFEKAISSVEKQLRVLTSTHPHVAARVDALTAVTGLGLNSALAIVAKLPADRLRNAKAAAAYAGLTPRERQSGTSVHGKPRICKTGNGSLRRDLYMPAVVAMRFNPILKTFAERLRERGKPGKVVVVAVMRKLIVLAFRILKNLEVPSAVAV